MKKLVLLLMALCLLSTCALAHADVINWEDIAPHLEELGLEGEFYTLNAVEAMLWVPAALQPIEDLPEDQVEERGLTASFMTEDHDRAINIVYNDAQGMTLEEYAELLPDTGAEHIVADTINGLNAVEYNLPSNHTMNVAFISDTGHLLEFTLFPFDEDDEAGNVEWATVISSIQPAA